MWRLPTLFWIALLSGVAIQPYLTGGFPATDDGKLHLYRLIELDHALRNGVVFPRWSPDLVFGYGFPLFNYYAPAPYYLGAAFHLTGISYQSALLASFAALTVLAGWAMYRLIDEIFGGPTAALVGAAAYVYAPYMGLVGVHRGALGEVAGMALMPLVLWGFYRLAKDGSGGAFALAAGSLGALLITHNVTALMFMPVLLAVLIVLWMSGQRTLQRAVALVGAILVGLMLGAVFWVPAFFERDLVQIGRLFIEITYLRIGDLFSIPAPSDPQQVLQPFPRAIGLPQVALALIAAWRLRGAAYSRQHKVLVSAMLVGVLFMAELMLEVSSLLWERVSLLAFLQFPWRWLGPLSLLLALLSGAAFTGAAFSGADANSGRVVDWLPARYRAPALILSVLMIAIYGMWWLFARYEPPLEASSLQDIHSFEVNLDAAGTTSHVEYLPLSVKQLPPADGLAERYAQADVIARLSEESLPSEVSLIEQSAGLTWARATVDSPAGFTANWDWFMFPGWQAWVDGERVAITASEPFGLIQFDVPPGRHQLEIRFGSTPLRLAAGLASLAALLVIGVLWWRLPGQALMRSEQGESGWRAVWPVVGALLLLLVIKVGYLNRAETPFRRTRFADGVVTGVSAPSRVLFEDAMVYLGHDIASDAVAAGEKLEVDLYWTVQTSLDENFSTSAVLADGAGRALTQADSQHPGGWPTSRWTEAQYAIDTHALQVAADTPPGMYDLLIAVYYVQGASNVPLAALDGAGNPAGTTILLRRIEVKRPAAPPRLEELGMDERVEVALSPAIELVGYSMAHQQQAGEDVPIELVWRASEALQADLLATLSLRDANGNSVIKREVPLVAASYSTSEWQAGDVLRGRHTLPLPVDLAAGSYGLDVMIGEGEAFSLGEIVVTKGIERVFELPEMQYASGQQWQGGIQLIGYDLMEVERQKLALTLYWTTDAELTDSYKAFVHVVDQSGEIIIQQDQIPANWRRPTSGWVASEVVRDEYMLALEEGLALGNFRLRVGLYDEASLDRVLLVGGSAEFLELSGLPAG